MDKCRQYSKRESAGITFFILKRRCDRVKKLDKTLKACFDILGDIDEYEILPPSKYLLYCVITFCNSFENHSRFACLFTCNGH